MRVDTLTVVQSIHDAACRHDPADLILLMEPLFGGGTSQEAIEGMLAVEPRGAAFDALAAVLETAGGADQGGITNCTPPSIGRGTVTEPGGWSDFGMARARTRPATDAPPARQRRSTRPNVSQTRASV